MVTLPWKTGHPTTGSPRVARSGGSRPSDKGEPGHPDPWDKGVRSHPRILTPPLDPPLAWVGGWAFYPRQLFPRESEALLTSNSFDASNSIAPGSIEPILNTCSTAAERWIEIVALVSDIIIHIRDKKWFWLNGNRSSRPKVISPETRVMSPEILSHVAQNFIECIDLKKSNIWSISQGI